MQTPRRITPRSTLYTALLAGFALAAGAPAQQPAKPSTQAAPEQAGRFSAQLDIREREILVSLPTSLAKSRLKPADFQVLVDGQPRDVSRAEPVSGGGAAPWTILVYVDRVLAGPATAFSSTVALADHARDLSRLGTVEVAVAGPEPGTVLAPTIETGVIRDKLSALADTARLERDHAQATGSTKLPSDLQVRQQLDKLLAFLATHHPAGPHILFLVADGTDLTAAQAGILTGSTIPAPDAAETAATSFVRVSRQLAAERWVVIPVVVHPGSPGTPVAPQSEIDLIQESAATTSHTNGPPPPMPYAATRQSALEFPNVVALSTEPRLAPLRALAEATTGTVVGYDVQLTALFAELPRRWTIWVAEPEAPADDHLHALAVRLPGKRADARAPLWLR
ncbi:MAG TPA: hypothetical protein VIE43_13090 [Thermoanaerobaculia bacterium]|nr:hypothetical protein [Thermoanaerobaculia bacterium]